MRGPALGLVLLLAVVGIVGLWTGPPFEGVWRWLAVGMLVVGVLEYLDSKWFPLEVSITCDQAELLGRANSYRLCVSNRGGRTRQLRVGMLAPIALNGEELKTHSAKLATGEHRLHDFELYATALGQHPWPAQPVEILGVFGLVSWIRHLPVSFVSQIQPDTRSRDTLPSGLSQYGPRSSVRKLAGGGEFHGMRAYQRGDSPATIDWKASARSGGLIVRETETEEHLEILFGIDAGKSSALHFGTLSLLHHAVNLSARLSEVAEANGDSYGLLAFADDIRARLPLARGSAQQMRLRNTLSGLGSTQHESNPLPAVVEMARMLRQRALVLLFVSLDDPDANGQLVRATQLLRPKHSPLVVALRDPDVIELVDRPAHSPLDAHTSLAAIEHQFEAALLRRRLERLGAVVVESEADSVEAALMKRYLQLRKL